MIRIPVNMPGAKRLYAECWIHPQRSEVLGFRGSQHGLGVDVRLDGCPYWVALSSRSLRIGTAEEWERYDRERGIRVEEAKGSKR